jgi:co-chaperonin GroES (HSP10)
MIDIAEAKKQGFGGDGGRQHVVKDRTIQPIGKRVLVSKMRFGDKRTRGGILLLDDDGKEGGIHPRWCQVYAVGPKQEDVAVGQWLLVAHGRWSRALKVEKGGVSQEVRMIDENDILLISDDEPVDSDLNRQVGYVNTGGMQQMTRMSGND